ncbi:MAG: hypothetical protein HQK96_20495 [Nitrospirae bacterium]|nr:hypothetical protein [Nitrospirota bacterium]MBF0556901.1 hypothetical protein [Nitrospirota bacterium]
MDTANALLKTEADIPQAEQWLYYNPEALKSVLIGLEDAKAGRVQKLNLDEL